MRRRKVQGWKLITLKEEEVGNGNKEEDEESLNTFF